MTKRVMVLLGFGGRRSALTSPTRRAGDAVPALVVAAMVLLCSTHGWRRASERGTRGQGHAPTNLDYVVAWLSSVGLSRSGLAGGCR